MRPDIGQCVDLQQQKQVEFQNVYAKDRTLRIGDTVYVTNFRGKTKWLHGVIVEQTGSVPFRVRLDDGRVVRRHVDHVLSRRVNDEKEEISVSEKELPLETLTFRPNEGEGSNGTLSVDANSYYRNIIIAYICLLG